MARVAVERNNTENAETAFVFVQDLYAIQWLKKLQTIANETIRKAEIHAFYGEYDTAEQFYLDADRRFYSVLLPSNHFLWNFSVAHKKQNTCISFQE